MQSQKRNLRKSHELINKNIKKESEKNNEQKRLSYPFGKKEEQREVENPVRESFWNVYRPGCLEHYVLYYLRKDPAFVPEFDFVMEKDGKLIGQLF